MKHIRKNEISTEDARQGEVILRTRFQKIVFVAGLATAVMVAVASSAILR